MAQIGLDYSAVSTAGAGATDYRMDGDSFVETQVKLSSTK